MTDEKQVEDLEKRIDELESRMGSKLPSRRDALKLGVGGLAGASLMSGTASAGSAQVGTIGNSNNRVDLFVEDVDISDTLTVGGQTTFNGPVAGVEGVPSGGIIMWSGPIANIPSGFALCDGSNGTPDLRDRFVIGAGGSEAVGNTGGTDTQSVNLSVSGTTEPAQFKGSQVTVAQSTQNFPGNFGHGGDDFLYWPRISANNAHQGDDGNIFGGDESVTPLRADFSGSGSDSFDNRPSYYALAYIMKL